MVFCTTCANRGATCKLCNDGDKYRPIPESAIKTLKFSEVPRRDEAWRDIPDKAVR